MPPELEWFANLASKATRRAYERALADFMRFSTSGNDQRAAHLLMAAAAEHVAQKIEAAGLVRREAQLGNQARHEPLSACHE